MDPRADGCPSQTRTHERARLDMLTYFSSLLRAPLTGQATSNKSPQTPSTALKIPINQGALGTTSPPRSWRLCAPLCMHGGWNGSSVWAERIHVSSPSRVPAALQRVEPPPCSHVSGLRQWPDCVNGWLKDYLHNSRNLSGESLHSYTEYCFYWGEFAVSDSIFKVNINSGSVVVVVVAAAGAAVVVC